jgi:hypothetical protein
LEVRRCGDSHPPVTKREREIRLNGTGGVKILKNPDRNFDPGFWLTRSGFKRRNNKERKRFNAFTLQRI